MNDERLFERLAGHGGPVEVDDVFEDRLYAILQRDIRRPQRMGGALLLVAALLTAIAITGAVAIGSGLVEPPWVDRLVVPTPSRAAESLEPGPTAAPSRPHSWTATGPMITPGRVGPATLLPNGTVLLAGGTVGSELLASAELFDPGSGSWVAAAAMLQGREGHTATLLSDGTVLVAGGNSRAEQDPALASAELYDPATGTWTATGQMTQPRTGHTATLLSDGRVLLAGGDSPDYLARPGDFSPHYLLSAELYDPVARTWTATADMIQARIGHTATLLPDGRVLVAGGSTADRLESAELYDPATGTWTGTADMTEPYFGHTATLLPDGRVLIAGGDAPSGPGARGWAHAELYNPVTGTWMATGSMVTPRLAHAATLLPDGRVLVSGGRADGGPQSALVREAELYDPATGRWTATRGMREARSGHSATLLADGRVLVSGGTDSDVLFSAESYDPGGGTR